MNFFAIAHLLGLLLAALAGSMVPSLLFALSYHDGSKGAIALSILVTAAAGGALYGVGRFKKQDLFRREATAVVGLGWFLCAAAGALPFYFHGVFDSFADCYFESMSGFTTTGSSVLTQIEGLPEGILFWRSFTHWLGGMGIIVLFVALLPFLGAGGRVLFKSETPGPVQEALTPRVKETAKILWTIYVVLSLAETVILMLLGMNLHEALCHTFGTMATGGFSTRNASIGAFGPATQYVIIVFMIAAATNFSLYYGVWKGERGALWKDAEWRAYIAIIAASAACIMAVLLVKQYYSGIEEAFRHSLFQTLAMMTTTGYCTADFDQWPTVVKHLMVILMFIGGSAGSTGGGIKVMRWLILVRTAGAMLEKVYSPRTVRKVRLGGATLSDDLQKATLCFFLIWVLIFAAGALALCLIEGDKVDLVTAVTASAATLNNIGPGLAKVGATQNYAFFSPVSKYLMSLFMVLGRLEYAILVLFVPRFWRVR